MEPVPMAVTVLVAPSRVAERVSAPPTMKLPAIPRSLVVLVYL
jgi:hypothetical protein